MNGRYEGFVGMSGGTHWLVVELADGEARLDYRARFMGQPFVHLRLQGPWRVLGRPGGDTGVGRIDLDEVLALDGMPPSVAWPPHDPPLAVDFVALAGPVRDDGPGNAIMDAAGAWNLTFSLVCWLHRDASFEDGSECWLSASQVPVARALAALQTPWKLAFEP